MLRGRVDRQVTFRFVIGDRDVRFHGVRVHHGEVEFAFGYVRGSSEGRVHIPPLDVHRLADIYGRARKIVEPTEGTIGEIRFVDASGFLRELRVNIEYRLEVLVSALHFSHRFLRAQFILLHYLRYSFPHPTNRTDGTPATLL